jgi:hypothetical protein
MDIVVFAPDELPVALAALRALVAIPSARQKRFIEVLARLHGQHVRGDRIWPAPLTLVATTIRGAHQRKRLVQLAVMMSMTGAQVEHAMAHAVAALARALTVREPAVMLLSLLAHGRTRAARINVLARVMRKLLTDARRAHGLGGVHTLLAGLLQRDREHRLERLAEYPTGSLGRALFEHIKTNPRALFHDLGHVLSGYDTDARGELQQGAFQAGFVRRDGFAFLLFALLQFHLGIRLTPLAAAAVGRFDIEKVLTALARGAACTIDLSSDWNFWRSAALPLASVRETLGIRSLPDRTLSSARAS